MTMGPVVHSNALSWSQSYSHASLPESSHDPSPLSYSYGQLQSFLSSLKLTMKKKKKKIKRAKKIKKI